MENNIAISLSEQQFTEEIEHQPTLFAEPIFYIGSFPVTNSLLTSWIVVFVMIVFSISITRRISLIPRKTQNLIEIILEKAMETADSVTGARNKTLKFLPIVFPLFVFILLNNWLGLFPGVGSIGFLGLHEGEKVFIPLFRGGTADLNTTLALALAAVILTHIFGIMFTNFWSHLNRFFGLKFLFEMPRKVFREKNYAALFLNPIHFFVGFIELIGEFSKVASLSFRLFGNIFAGEVLLAAIAAMFAFVLPIPFIFLEILIGIIQALIFSLLTLVFLTVMSQKHEEAH